MSDATTVTIQTAPGRSALAVVAVEGAAAMAAVDACFGAASGKPLADQPPGAIRFGRWGADDGEEVVVCHRADPARKRVEVHCHGGAAAVRAVVDRLVEQGCVEQTWRDELSGSYASRVAVEAAHALRVALTERTGAVALDQVEGAMLRELTMLLNLPDPRQLAASLIELLTWSALGNHLTQPWRVVLAGAPNVGKSSLINALLGYDRVIVFNQPGTTRDVVTADAAIAGWPVTLADTAGLRESSDAVEAAGIQLARQAVATADLVIEVRDASDPQPWSLPLPANRMLVWNKADLAAPPAGEPGLLTSAVTGSGVERLLSKIAEQLVPHTPPAGQAVPLSEWQAAELVRALHHAAAGDRTAARRTLQAMLAPA